MRFLPLYLALSLCGMFAAEPRLKPRHDPADQLFRRAPMAEAARSVIVKLATNLHYAFDADLCRVHTVWQGGPLNLWGPPYSYSKSPSICDFEGTRLFSFPQVSSWWSQGNPLGTRFHAMDTANGKVRFFYEVRVPDHPVNVVESWQGSTSDDRWTLRRTLHFPEGNADELSLLTFAEAGATTQRRGNEIEISSTNGLVILTGASEVKSEVVSYEILPITEEGTEKGFTRTGFRGDELRAYLPIPAQTTALTVELTLRHGSSLEPAARLEETTKTYGPSPDLRAPAGDESYKIEYFPLPSEAEMMITGMDWLRNGDLGVCTWLGEVYIVRNATGDVRGATYQRFARGLNEPLGLTVNNDQIFVVQKGELTRLVDSNKDGLADRFECINSSWGYSGNYHSYSFGPLITQDNNFLVFITGQRGLYELPYQGWALRISASGNDVEPFCSGLRVPHGWGFYGPENDVFATDNQGNWIGACRLNHLQRNKFYGFPSSQPAPKRTHRAEEVEPPALWFPRSLAPSASGFDTITDDRFGPFKGQMLIGDFQNSIVMRASLEKVQGRWQGAVFPFAKGFLSGVNRLKMGPDGKLYVGGGKRTWSTAAPKEYSLDRIAFTGKVPFEVKEVHATPGGFHLVFTKPIDRSTSDKPANYLVKQFTYQYHQEYGSPEFDQKGRVGATELRVANAVVSDDGLGVRLEIPGLQAGFVTSFQVAVSSVDDEDLRSDTFYYTLNTRPTAQ